MHLVVECTVVFGVYLMNYSMSKNIILLGYSGHSFVCIETALQSGFQVIGYYDIEEKIANPYQLQYLGTEENSIKDNNLLFIGIGDNSIRESIFNKFKNENRFVSLIHSKSIISPTSSIANNVLVSAGAIINAHAKIDFGSIINTSAVIEHECKIEKFAHIAPGAVLAGNVCVGERSFIGANATVKQGVKIGNDAIIGAGTVIINDIPNNSIVVGNPGIIIKKNI